MKKQNKMETKTMYLLVQVEFISKKKISKKKAEKAIQELDYSFKSQVKDIDVENSEIVEISHEYPDNF